MDVVNLRQRDRQPADAARIIRRTGRSEQEVARLLNYILGSTFVSGEMVAGWATGLSTPPPDWLRILVDLTLPGVPFGLAG